MRVQTERKMLSTDEAQMNTKTQRNLQNSLGTNSAMALKPNTRNHKNHRDTSSIKIAETETVGVFQHHLGHQELLEDQESLEDKIYEDSLLLCPLMAYCCCWQAQASETHGSKEKRHTLLLFCFMMQTASAERQPKAAMFSVGNRNAGMLPG